MGAIMLDEITQLSTKNNVKKLLARIVTKREGVIRAFERADFSKITVLPNFVKDLHNREYADIALLVKELPTEVQLDS